jgi:hypothetical protein
VDQHADLQDALANIGLGRVCYLRTLYYDDVIRLVGPDADIEPGQHCFALISASGEPLCIRGSVADCMHVAEQGDLAIATVH